MKILALQLETLPVLNSVALSLHINFFLLKVQNRLLYTLGRYTGTSLSSGPLADRHSIKVTRANLSWGTGKLLTSFSLSKTQSSLETSGRKNAPSWGVREVHNSAWRGSQTITQTVHTEQGDMRKVSNFLLFYLCLLNFARGGRLATRSPKVILSNSELVL